MVKPLSSNQKLVLFDIDGTLIRAHYPPAKARYDHAFSKHLGPRYKYKIDWNVFSGTTDRYLFKQIYKNNIPDDELSEKKLLEIYEDAYDFLAKSLVKNDYKKRLIKEAYLLVKKLAKQKNIFLGLLTGNEKKVAMLKIKTTGLDKLFSFGIYGEEADNRDLLAQLALKKATAFFKTKFNLNDIYIIGDTPRDIFCGKSIKVKTIGVTTGQFSKEELEITKPDLLVDNLADKKVLKFINK